MGTHSLVTTSRGCCQGRAQGKVLTSHQLWHRPSSATLAGLCSHLLAARWPGEGFVVRCSAALGPALPAHTQGLADRSRGGGAAEGRGTFLLPRARRA